MRHLLDLKIGENITTKRRQISRIPCEVEWKKLFLLERRHIKIRSKIKSELEDFYHPDAILVIYDGLYGYPHKGRDLVKILI